MLGSELTNERNSKKSISKELEKFREERKTEKEEFVKLSSSYE